jgi:hypothetical protein
VNTNEVPSQEDRKNDEMNELTQRNSGRGRKTPEISWTFTPRIDPGQYPAISRSATVYRDRQFKRWVCAVQFDILDSSLINILARLTWYINLGTGDKPHAGRRGNFWAAWVRANGGPPKRNDRLSPRVFERRHAVVRVNDTGKNHRQDKVGAEESYSVVREVVEWPTGVPLRRNTNHAHSSFVVSNDHSNQPIKAGLGEVLPAEAVSTPACQ